MTQAISSAGCSGFASELAAMLIENESAQAESARQQREAARSAFLDDAQRQIDALHDAASATETGALLGASLSIASGACQIGAAGFQYETDMGKANHECAREVAGNQLDASILSNLGSTSAQLAGPTKTMLGDSVAAHFQAEAKRSETLAEQAKWQASDASSAIDKAESRIDKVLDLLQGIQRDQNSATSALINRI